MANAASPSARGPSGSAGSSAPLSHRALGRACSEAIDRIQLVSELLLLRESTTQPVAREPVSNGTKSFGKSRDAIVANTKGLAILIKEFSSQLSHQNITGVFFLVRQVADQVIVLVEAATHAAYLTALQDEGCRPASPGSVDHYAFAKARQAVHIAYSRFVENSSLSREQVLEVSKTFADSLAVITQGCKSAAQSKQALSESDRLQFANCAQALQGSTVPLLSSLKAYATSESREDLRKCLLFGRPVLETVDCVVEYGHFPQFTGQPAKLTERGRASQTEILGGAMAAVGSCIQLLRNTKGLLEGKSLSDPKQWQKIVNCSKAIADSTKLLSSSLKFHSPGPSRSTSMQSYAQH